jgi:hypothetical protein
MARPVITVPVKAAQEVSPGRSPSARSRRPSGTAWRSARASATGWQGLALLHVSAHLILVPGERRLVVVRGRGQFTGEHVGGNQGHRGTEPDERRAAVPSVAEQYRPTPVRLDRLEEAVQVCRAMFTGDHVSFSGTHYRLDGARNLPRPVQAGGPKIMIGGGGEKRTLRLVARYADMCNVTGDASTLARKVGVLQRHCAEVGRDPAEVSVTWMTPLILTTSSQSTAETREMLAAASSAEDIAGFTVGQPHEIPGLVAGHIEAGADEVVFSLPFADTAGITAVGDALGLGGSAG